MNKKEFKKIVHNTFEVQAKKVTHTINLLTGEQKKKKKALKYSEYGTFNRAATF